jgi:hypothetical protein
MEKYRNLSGKSGVHSYEIGNDYIRVKFSGTSKVYTYSYRKAGSYDVEKMKYLASTGSGLNSYIDQFVKYKYD